MNKKLLALYGLKFNPFSQQVPASALCSSAALESFSWRIEQQVGEGGFALIVGDPGCGKSAALRLLELRLSNLRDLSLGVLTRPQAQVADFYRELGHLFHVPMTPHNRWNSAKVLRERWLAHIDSCLSRPVLLVDEAQEMNTAAFSELRLLASAELDSRCLLTIILAGDHRLTHRLSSPDLLPIASRIRSRLALDALCPKELQEHLLHLLTAAGNPNLFPPPLVQTLCEHAAGNLRLLMSLSLDLLAAASHQQLDRIDEKLFFQVFNPSSKPSKK